MFENLLVQLSVIASALTVLVFPCNRNVFLVASWSRSDGQGHLQIFIDIVRVTADI